MLTAPGGTAGVLGVVNAASMLRAAAAAAVLAARAAGRSVEAGLKSEKNMWKLRIFHFYLNFLSFFYNFLKKIFIFILSRNF